MAPLAAPRRRAALHLRPVRLLRARRGQGIAEGVGAAPGARRRRHGGREADAYPDPGDRHRSGHLHDPGQAADQRSAHDRALPRGPGRPEGGPAVHDRPAPPPGRAPAGRGEPVAGAGPAPTGGGGRRPRPGAARERRVEDRRYAKLVEQGFVAREQYDQIHTSLESMGATVQADEAAVENARAPSSRTRRRWRARGFSSRTRRIRRAHGRPHRQPPGPGRQLVKANEDNRARHIAQVRPDLRLVRRARAAAHGDQAVHGGRPARRPRSSLRAPASTRGRRP